MTEASKNLAAKNQEETALGLRHKNTETMKETSNV